jgi:hypothetical protein
MREVHRRVERLSGWDAVSPDIEATTRWLVTAARPGGRLVFTSYRWIGPSHRTATVVGFHALRDLERAHAEGRLPWPILVIEHQIWHGGAVVARADGANLFTARLWRLRARLRSALQHFEVRVVLTADVWGLAQVPTHERPSWAHLRAGVRARFRREGDRHAGRDA